MRGWAKKKVIIALRRGANKSKKTNNNKTKHRGAKRMWLESDVVLFPGISQILVLELIAGEEGHRIYDVRSEC